MDTLILFSAIQHWRRKETDRGAYLCARSPPPSQQHWVQIGIADGLDGAGRGPRRAPRKRGVT